MLTARENMFRVFSQDQQPERVPLVSHIDPYNQPNQRGMDPELAQKMKNVQWQDENTMVFSRYLGVDIMDYLNPPIRVTRNKVTIETHREGRDTTNIWHTPAGDLQEVVRVSEDGNTSYRIKHLVEEPKDLPALAAVFADEKLELDPAGVERVRQRSQAIGDDGMLMFFCPGTPMGMMYRVYSGVAPLIYCYADAPQALADLFKVMEANYQELYRLAATMAADALVGMDDTSTTAISPAMFEQFNMELTDQRTDIAHAAGKLYFHHSCGLIKNLLPIYRQTRMDAVHAYTVPPTGDTRIADRHLLGDRIVIIAGAGPMGNDMSDRAAAAAELKGMFEEAGDKKRFIVGISGYPDKTVEQTQFVVNECRKYCKIG